jgi:hypothetical protein
LLITTSSQNTSDQRDEADADAVGSPITVPDTGDHGESGKLKMIVQLVKRSLGVKDLAAMSVASSNHMPQHD